MQTDVVEIRHQINPFSGWENPFSFGIEWESAVSRERKKKMMLKSDVLDKNGAYYLWQVKPGKVCLGGLGKMG